MVMGQHKLGLIDFIQGSSMVVKEYKCCSSLTIGLIEHHIFDSHDVQVCKVTYSIFHYCHGYNLNWLHKGTLNVNGFILSMMCTSSEIIGDNLKGKEELEASLALVWSRIRDIILLGLLKVAHGNSIYLD